MSTNRVVVTGYGVTSPIGNTPEEFWKLTEEFCKKYDMDKILGYLYMMIKACKEKNIKLTKDVNYKFYRYN